MRSRSDHSSNRIGDTASSVDATVCENKFADVPDAVRRRMSSIRKTGNKPEMSVRKVAYRLGYRFRVNQRNLPGTPDIVFPSRRKIIQVHGCFWHQHPGCRHSTSPRVRSEYWGPKLARNVSRDIEIRSALEAQGWAVLTLWGCELGDDSSLEARLIAFLAA